MLRHERMSVAMALAEKLHHSAQRPEMARAGEEDLELYYTAEFGTHPPPQAVYFAMDVDDVPAALGSRPDRLSEVRPQERTQRRTVQQIVDPVHSLPTLDDPAPQMVEQLLNLAHFLDIPLPDPEQVIEVPKILSDDVPMRALVRETQLAEQLVEVPTIVSWSLLQLITKQNVDIPVPGGGVRGLQGFLPGQVSTTSSFSLERFSEQIVEQNVEFPVDGGLHDFLPGQSSSATSSSPAGVRGSADVPGEGVFRTFPQIKKSAKLGSHSGSELLPESSPSTPAAHVDALSGVELLAKFQQLSDQVEDTKRTYSSNWKGFSNDIEMLYRLITDVEHRLEQLEAWADEVAGDDDGPG